ncbi:MAG: hypothetical protein AAF467_22575 [Actinomycetota bacterium]
MSTNRIDEIRADLERIADDLAEHALTVLRDAMEEGATKRPAEEKAITQARRAVEKAVRLLDLDGSGQSSRDDVFD